jgi:hypothetical protein
MTKLKVGVSIILSDSVITENVVCLPTPSAAGTDRG